MSLHLLGGGPAPRRASPQVMLCPQYILNEAEARVKAELWMRENAEYLREQRGECRPPWRPGWEALADQLLLSFQRRKPALPRRRSWASTRSRRWALLEPLPPTSGAGMGGVPAVRSGGEAPGRLWGLGAWPPVLCGRSDGAEWLLWVDGDVWLELPRGVVRPVVDLEETGAGVRQAGVAAAQRLCSQPLDPERRPGAGSGLGAWSWSVSGPRGGCSGGGGLERRRRLLQGPPSLLVTAQPGHPARSSLLGPGPGMGEAAWWAGGSARSLGGAVGRGAPAPSPF